MLDTAVAALYGVTIKALNQAVKKNGDRFPGRPDCVLAGSALSDQKRRGRIMTVLRYRRHWRAYETEAGRRPVVEFIRAQPEGDRIKIYAAMHDVAMNGLPAARHLRGDLYEVRAEGRNQTFRILFATEGRFGQVLLSLEAFSKKTQKTPPAKIELAEHRLREWRSRRQR